MPNPKSKSGPRCIALIGPYGSGKTLLLESIAAVTGAVTRKGSVSGRHQPGRFLRRSARPADERRTQCAFHPISGRGFHLPGLSRLHRIPGRHAECAASGRCRRGGVRARTGEGPDAAALPQGAGGRQGPALSLRQQDRSCRRVRCASLLALAAGCERDAACCCARFRSGKMASPPALSIWRWNGPLSIARMRRPKWSTSPICSREKEARFQMLERLADYDEHLMEELLGDIEPRARRSDERSEARTGGRPGGAGADRLGRGRSWRAASAQGAAPRSAGSAGGGGTRAA